MTVPLKIIPKKDFEGENKKPNQREVWDSIAEKWEVYVVKKIPVVGEFLRGKNGRVIDLGCGNGRNMLRVKGIEYYGVDFSEQMIKNAEKYTKNEKIKAKLFRARADNLSLFSNEMFDYGLFMATIHCLESERKRAKALKEFYRVLKKGAEALVSVWLSEDSRFSGKGKDIYMSWRKEGKDLMRYYHLYHKEEFIKLLEGAGFELLEIYKPYLHDRFSKKNLIVRVRK